MKRIILLIGLGILMLAIATGCGKRVFNGSRISNNKQFVMDYTILNRTDSHTMELKEGTTIDVVIEHKAGRLDVLVADASGKEIYRGDKAASGKFTIKIPKTETYKISITGNKAKGSVSFKVAN